MAKMYFNNINMLNYKSLGQSLLLGLIVGLLFSFVDLPIPAPDNLSAILGIIGLFSGMLIVKYVRS